MDALFAKDNLHQYQRYSADFICKNPHTALLLSCGLGKTVITLTAIDELLFDRFEVRKVLVICPLRVSVVWAGEIRKWDHLKGLTYTVAVGTEAERRAALQQSASIYIINRENVQSSVPRANMPLIFKNIFFRLSWPLAVPPNTLSFSPLGRTLL